MQPGDVIIALPSTGVHSNGFSLVRKIFDLENNPDVLKKTFDGMDKTLGEALLAPTKIYVKPVLAVMKEVTVKGVSHITGGGFYENIPRSLKAGCCAVIKKSDVRTPVLFDVLAKEGNIPERDMFNTFNMGVGMILTVAAEDADKAIEILKANGEDAYRLGVIGRRQRGAAGMMKIAVLVSGGGTNLQAILESERRGENPNGKVTLVVASKTWCVCVGTRCKLRRGNRRGAPQGLRHQRGV